MYERAGWNKNQDKNWDLIQDCFYNQKIYIYQYIEKLDLFLFDHSDNFGLNFQKFLHDISIFLFEK